VPYFGWLAGSVVALTTRRADQRRGNITADPAHVATAGPRRSSWLTGSRAAVIILVALVPVVVAASYYIGRQSATGSDPKASPVWIDREIGATGTQGVGTLRCTYHMGDGSVRVRESIVALATTAPFRYDPFGNPNSLGAQTPDCPSAP
jgi:hypothetical protein